MMRNALLACLLILAGVMTHARAAEAVDLVRDGEPRACIVIADDGDDLLRRAADILNRNLRERSGGALPIVSEAAADKHDVVIVLDTVGGAAPFADTAPAWPEAVKDGDAFVIKTVAAGPQRRIYVLGANSRSVIYGVGRLLRDLNYSEDDVSGTPTDRQEAADSTMRGLWFANHQGDTGYEVMSMPQFRTYLEDVLLWGIDTVAYAPIDFHNWPPEVFTDPAEFDKHMKRNVVDVPDVIDDYDLRIGVKMFVNNVFAGDAQRLGLKLKESEGGDSSITHLFGPRKGFVCPSDEKSRQRLMEIREELFRRLPRVDFFVAHTTDFGGCVCDECEPYADVYVRLMSDYTRMVQRHHPRAKAGINFYNLTEKGKQSLLRYLEEDGGRTVGYVYFGLDPAAEPADLRRLPGGLSAYTFYDVAMWPFWGIYGAMPQLSPRNLHLSLERDRRIAAEPNYVGAIPYSEGLHEDITRSIYSAWLWDHDVKTQDVLDEYCRFYLGRSDGELMKLLHGMDQTNDIYTDSRALFGGVKSELTDDQLAKKTLETCIRLKPLAAEQLPRMRHIHDSLPAWARNGWRWKSLQVRVLFDHLYTHYLEMTAEQQQERRQEIIDLGREIHAETSYGILRSDRDIERLDENYTRLVNNRLKRIYGQ